MSVSETLVHARGLHVRHPLRASWPWQPRMAIRAVDGLDLDLHAGEALGLVGESGCGKSTLARALSGLQPTHSGRLVICGREVSADNNAWSALRRHVQMVFQDPLASLSPRMSAGEMVAEPLRNLCPELGAQARRERVLDTLTRVGLSAQHLHRYPHTLSGGQCQRVGIARALAVAPRVLICDEPVSALDVSIQAQVINLLKSLSQELHLALLFIAHDLAVVRHVSDRVAVMYAGSIMEHGPRDAVFARPRHPYTRALLSAVPIPDPARERSRRRILLEGEPITLTAPPTGCVFRTRCPWAAARCAEEVPELRRVGMNQHAACHFAEELAARDVG